MATRKKARKAAPKRKSSPARKANTASVVLPRLPVKTVLSKHALAYTFAVLMALDVLIVSILGSFGYISGAVQIYQGSLLSYSLTFAGVVAGMAEAAIYGLIAGFLGGWLYNKFSS
ncbi:hypothetical protein COV20_02890 [Candidatus Woesearchaeota archaeon CG10_big_fil_rev_8_21_14_0_10_45_16]|nr:MAG: hypothetical protein COV20_02890 [Candidatus Woesearchaeota archaeon CG10_big_fil_rev_8_21_14_0_10_45_16]